MAPGAADRSTAERWDDAVICHIHILRLVVECNQEPSGVPDLAGFV